jgi:hypothetical protein
VTAPYINADRYAPRLRNSLERAVGRRVAIGRVRFSMWNGPGFTVERNASGPGVIIYEDPSIGLEPVAYVETMEVRPSLLSLLGGRFVVNSIRLEDASINLVKSGPASEWGRWNFASAVDRKVMRNVPAIHVRNGRINFKFGDTKSVFYLTQTDLDITPPSGAGGWSIVCSAKPSRTDRPAQGLGSFTLKGRWYVAPERVDLDLELDRSGLGEVTALARGQSGSVHGTVSSRLHLGGPINAIGISGRLNIQDIHRWDLLPPYGQSWPFEIRGRLDLVGQQIELETTSQGNAALPLAFRFRANNYLSQPRWAVSANWNRFPAAPILELARHMGVQLPPKLALSGTLDGAIGYSGEKGFQGELAFQDTALTIPDSPPVRFDKATLVVDRGHAHLTPSVVRTASGDEAQIEADYTSEGMFDLTISTQSMNVESLHAQAALAAVPWLEQVRAGKWRGNLRYHHEPPESGWSGKLSLSDCRIPVPGLANPVELASARAQIDGKRVLIDHMDAKTGKLAFAGDYRFDPKAARPHRLRLRAGEVDAATLEDELLPSLRRNPGLIARALGRASVPAWLRQRGVEATVSIDDLSLAGSHLEGVRSHLLWDSTRVEVTELHARLDQGTITGKLDMNLRGARPSYRFSGKLKGLNWQGGKLDGEGEIATSGTGSQLLTNLSSEGSFTGAGLEFGPAGAMRSVAGQYQLVWAQDSPKWSLTNLSIRTEDDTYTGKGASQDDGKLSVVLNSGSKEMRMSGTVARLRIEEPARP